MAGPLRLGAAGAGAPGRLGEAAGCGKPAIVPLPPNLAFRLGSTNLLQWLLVAMEHPDPPDARRAIPSVDRLLSDPAVALLLPLYGRDQVRVQARKEVEALRGWLAAETSPAAAVERSLAELPRRLEAGLAAVFGRPLARVLNATGIFVHTNLGRAPLPAAVAAGLPPLLDAYCDLEIDLASGRRGERNARVERLMTTLNRSEAAVVVNNNAAALVLTLAALARDREVVVSRGELVEIGGSLRIPEIPAPARAREVVVSGGELVEIGGSFRIPEILAAAGARLVEVGATNRTRLAHYGAAIGPQPALLLKVFPSNFRQLGFVATLRPGELAPLGREAGVPVLVDGG